MVVRFVGLDASIQPYVLPELRRLRDTPVPEIIVVVQWRPMFLHGSFQEMVDLCGFRRRVPPQLVGTRRPISGHFAGASSSCYIQLDSYTGKKMSGAMEKGGEQKKRMAACSYLPGARDTGLSCFG